MLVHDGNHLTPGRLVVSTNNFIEGSSAVQVVENEIHNLIQLRRNHTDPAFDIISEDKMVAKVLFEYFPTPKLIK